MARIKAVDENGLPIERRGRGGLLIAGVVTVALAAAAVGAFFYMPSIMEQARAATASAPAVPAASAPGTLVAQAAPKGTRDGAAPSTKTTTTTSTYGGWTVQCGETADAKVCSANFRVVNKESNANLLVWAFGFNKDGTLLTEIHTLTDVLIEPGVVLTLDGSAPVKVPYVECSTRGCKARMELSTDMVRQLKGAAKAQIDMTRLDGQVIQFAMEIPGIDQALAELGV